MRKPGQKLSFKIVIRFGLVLFFSLCCLRIFAQETIVAGIVFDKESKERIARINVMDLNTKKWAYNNLNGVFKIEAQPGDLLVFSRLDYFSDTIKVENYIPLAIYMHRMGIQLKEVTINDSLLSPQKKLENTKKDYSKAYGRLAYKDFLSLPSYGGAGLSIDALWNSISREGRNAAHLRANIEKDYQQDVIDYRFNKSLVERVTGLKDKKLSDFMQKFRPSYYMVTTASDYDFILSIKNNYKRFLRNPRPYILQPLVAGKQ